MRVRKGKKRAEIEVLTQKGILRNGRRLRGRPKMKKLMKKDEKKVKYLLEKYY